MSSSPHLPALKLFSEKSQKLRSLPFTQDLIIQGSGFRWNFDHLQGVTSERWGPSADAIDAFVLTIRFFIQDKDQCSLRNMTARIEALYAENQITAELRDRWNGWRDAINDFLDSPTFVTERDEHKGVPIREERYTHRRIMEIFVYGALAHSDPEKSERISMWKANTTGVLPLFEKLFVDTIAELLYGLEGARASVIDPLIDILEHR